MDIQVATLCDYAADYNGKMVISGTIDALMARALPVVQPHCCLAMRVCMTPEDNGQHQMEINIIDADGGSLNEQFPIKADMPIEMPDTVSFVTRNLIMNFQGLQFPAVGVYSVDISVDGELLQRLPLRVVKAQSPEGASQAS